jgi:outer membrane cobalamin receptor
MVFQLLMHLGINCFTIYVCIADQVESIEIMKGASTFIYGSGAATGLLPLL